MAHLGAMEVVKVIEEAHESTITSIAFNKVRKEIFSAADGDKVIKVSTRDEACSPVVDMCHDFIDLWSGSGLGLQNRAAVAHATGS
jgi:hypothetical protein